MQIRFVDLPRQNKVLEAKLLPAIKKVIRKATFIKGKSLEEFEAAFAKFCGKKYGVGVNSGTDALKFALLAYGIGPGDEVITAPNSYFSSAMVISNVGATPIFVDVDPLSYNINSQQLEQAISKKTKAIIPVHLYGQPAQMDQVLKIAKKHKLLVIEDCCQAHGAKFQGKTVPVGETGAFSFYPGKNLGCFGDGGILVTDNAKVAEAVKYLRNDGSIEKYIHQMVGHKSALDTIQAAILSVKLPFLDSWNGNRRRHAKLYNQLLKNIPQVITPVELIDRTHVYHLYVIETYQRDQLQAHLKQKGIETGIHYPIPIHLQPAYKQYRYKKGDFPVAEQKSEVILSLPMFPELTNKQISYVCQVIADFFKHS